jgi:hypothetical protein
MKVTTVSYQRTYPLAQFSNEKIEVVVEVQDGDDVQEALARAKTTADKFHKDTNPQLYGEKPKLEPELQVYKDLMIPAKEDTPEEKKWKARMGAITKVDELVKWINKCPKPIYMARLEELSK